MVGINANTKTQSKPISSKLDIILNKYAQIVNVITYQYIFYIIIFDRRLIMIINKLLLKLFGICFFVSTGKVYSNAFDTVCLLIKQIIFHLFIFLAIQKSNYNYLGCFLGDNLLSLGDERHNSSFISPKSCSELCSKKNYTFFFLKNEYGCK